MHTARCITLRSVTTTFRSRPTYMLVLRMLIQISSALIDLILHQVIDPHAHLDVVLQHHEYHTIEREPKVILLDGELFELLLMDLQLLVTLCYHLKGAHSCVVLSRHCSEARSPYAFELLIQSYDHLFNVVWVAMHELVCQEPAPLKYDHLVHLLVLSKLTKGLLSLTQLMVDIILLFLTDGQFLVD